MLGVNRVSKIVSMCNKMKVQVLDKDLIELTIKNIVKIELILSLSR